MGIPMLKIRRPVGRLIFNMGIAIPSKTVFLIETAPRSFSKVFNLRAEACPYFQTMMLRMMRLALLWMKHGAVLHMTSFKPCLTQSHPSSDIVTQKIQGLNIEAWTKLRIALTKTQHNILWFPLWIFVYLQILQCTIYTAHSRKFNHTCIKNVHT